MAKKKDPNAPKRPSISRVRKLKEEDNVGIFTLDEHISELKSRLGATVDISEIEDEVIQEAKGRTINPGAYLSQDDECITFVDKGKTITVFRNPRADENFPLEIKRLRVFYRSFKKMQDSRIGLGNRICANFRARVGILAGVNKHHDKQDEEKQNLSILTYALEDYRAILEANLGGKNLRLTDLIISRQSSWLDCSMGKIIQDAHELSIMKQYGMFVNEEKTAEKDLKRAVEAIPFYKYWLEGVRGIGITMGSVLLAHVNIWKIKTPAELHQYCGCGVGHDEKAMSWRKEHLIDRYYFAKDGTIKVKDSTVYSPFMKTQVLGVMAPCLIKQNPEYKKIYNDYKHRKTQENNINVQQGGEPKTKLHLHRMASRYMVKQFLIDFFIAYKQFLGLPYSPPYHEAKLGLKHGEPKIFFDKPYAG